MMISGAKVCTAVYVIWTTLILTFIAYVRQAVNGDYLRKEALTLLADCGYKAEVLGGNLSDHLLKGCLLCVSEFYNH
jgi:hypothetical protein